MYSNLPYLTSTADELLQVNTQQFALELLEHEIQHPTSTMRLSTGLLLPTLIGAVSAASDAKVYLFQGDEWPNTSKPPTLSPKEARLVFAQRLGVSRYHSLDDVGEDTLSYINQFGGPQEQLFGGNGQDKAPELVLLVEGVSAEHAEPLLSAWSSIQPAFTISNPPSSSENLELAFNLDRQLGPDVQACPFEQDIDPGNRKCWKGRSKILQIDLTSKASGTLLFDVFKLLITDNSDLGSARCCSRRKDWLISRNIRR
jgi:hypothetical protein